MKRLFDGKDVFPFAKPSALLQRLVDIFAHGESIVMDFFAGSGSTAHGVVAQNAADGIARQCISIQLAEPCDPKSVAARAGYETISELSRERIRRCGSELVRAPSTVGWNGDVGFRALRVDTTNMADVLRSPDEVEQQALAGFESSVKPDRTGEDLLFQVLLDWGLDLTMTIDVEQVGDYEVFVIEDNALVACFDNEVTADLVQFVAKREPLRAVFRDSGFATDDVRINAEQIFKELSPATDVKAI